MNIANFSRLLKVTQAIRRPGSAALDLCYVAWTLRRLLGV